MNIESLNDYKGEFFKILHTSDQFQYGVMTLEAGGDSGPEDIHPGIQFIYVIEGEISAVVNGEEVVVHHGSSCIIPKGAQHHLYNRSDKLAFFLTAYTPPAY